MSPQEIAAITSRLDGITSSLHGVSRKVEKIDITIRGDDTASPGLITRMALMDVRLDKFDAFTDEVHSFKRWVALGILGLFGSLAWQVVEWYFSQKP